MPPRPLTPDVEAVNACLTLNRRFLGIFGRCDPFLNEGVPLVTLRALPEKLSAAIATSNTDVRIEVEDGVVHQSHVPICQGWIERESGESLPDRLVDG